MVSILVTVGTLTVAWRESKTGQVEAAYGRIQWLEQTTLAQSALLAEKMSEIEALKFRLSLEHDTLDAICAVIDAMIVPAWVKEHLPDAPADQRIRMRCINPEYEQMFQVSRQRYRDATDIEIHGPTLGMQYMQHDLRVIATREGETFDEVVRTRDGNTQTQRFTKIYLRSQDGREFIPGFSVPGGG